MPEQKIDPNAVTSIVQWYKSAAVPPRVAIIVAKGVVVWVGPAEQLPNVDEKGWPDPISINVDPTTFDIVKVKAAEQEKGITIQ